MDIYSYEFTTKLKGHQFGRANYVVAFLPQKLIRELPLDKHPRLRIDGEINGFRFNNALHPSNGKWYVLVPKKTRTQCRIKLGSTVLVQFNIGDQNAVDVPQELNQALNVNDTANSVWNELTPGKRRGFAYRVNSAKRRETRENRVEEVIHDLLKLDAGQKIQRRSRWG